MLNQFFPLFSDLVQITLNMRVVVVEQLDGKNMHAIVKSVL